MRTFLGMFIVLIVSGDEPKNTGILGGNGHLPCACSERNLDMEFKWQMEEPKKMLILRDYNHILNITDTYKDRAKTFLNGSRSDCSLQLTNFRNNDSGKYRCSFYSQGQYKKFFVNLNISEINSDQQNSGNSKNEINSDQQNSGNSKNGSSYWFYWFFAIPIMLVLGFSLYKYWKFSQRKVETELQCENMITVQGGST